MIVLGVISLIGWGFSVEFLKTLHRDSGIATNPISAMGLILVASALAIHNIGSLDGRYQAIDEAMRVEVAEARWLPLDEAPRLLSYDGERKMAAKALERLEQ